MFWDSYTWLECNQLLLNMANKALFVIPITPFFRPSRRFYLFWNATIKTNICVSTTVNSLGTLPVPPNTSRGFSSTRVYYNCTSVRSSWLFSKNIITYWYYLDLFFLTHEYSDVWIKIFDFSSKIFYNTMIIISMHSLKRDYYIDLDPAKIMSLIFDRITPRKNIIITENIFSTLRSSSLCIIYILLENNIRLTPLNLYWQVEIINNIPVSICIYTGGIGVFITIRNW